MFEQYWQGRVERSKLVGQFASAMLYALLIVNGGGLLGLLGFFGEAEAEFAALKPLTGAILLLLAGLVAAVLAAMFAFFAQQDYSHEEGEDALSVLARGSAKRVRRDNAAKYMQSGQRWQFTAIFLSVASLVLFVAAVCSAVTHINAAPSEPPAVTPTAPTPITVNTIQIDVNAPREPCRDCAPARPDRSPRYYRA